MDKVGKRYRRVSHRIQESSADLMQSADQSLSNHQEVKVYGARAAEFERYSALADRHMRLSLKVESTRSISSAMRSEEHTSELQSLMRISYAVFCLKKKKTQ